METKYLEYILTIAEERNMTKAAERLYVSQSSLSYYLSKLEQELNTSLFIRSRNEFILTPAGEKYVAAARQVLEIKRHLYQDIAGMQNQGSLSIASTSLWGTQTIAKVIPQFQKAFPGITFRLESEMDLTGILRQIDAEKLDVALAAVPSTEWLGKDRNYMFLCEEELLVALPKGHPYVQAHPCHVMKQSDMLDLFSHETVILSRKGSANRILIDGIMERNHTYPLSIYEVNGMSATSYLISQNTGAGIVPTSIMCLQTSLWAYSLDPPIYRHDVLLFRKHASLGQPEQDLIRYIRDAMPTRWNYEPD